MSHIVKRAGHTEKFDERKLYASIYAVNLSVREQQETAELIAGKVVDDFKEWLKNKTEITSHDIRRVAAKHLHAYNEDAAYLYEHHRIIH